MVGFIEAEGPDQASPMPMMSNGAKKLFTCVSPGPFVFVFGGRSMGFHENGIATADYGFVGLSTCVLYKFPESNTASSIFSALDPFAAAATGVPNVARKTNSADAKVVAIGTVDFVVATAKVIPHLDLCGQISPMDCKTRLPLGSHEGSSPLLTKGSPTPPENSFILPMGLRAPTSKGDRSSKGFMISWNVLVSIPTALQGYDLTWSEPASDTMVGCPGFSGHGRVGTICRFTSRSSLDCSLVHCLGWILGLVTIRCSKNGILICRYPNHSVRMSLL